MVSKANFAFSYAVENGYTVNAHKHACYEVIYYISCIGKTQIGGREYSFSPDTIAFIYPETPHDEHHFSDGKLMYIGFDTCLDILPPQGMIMQKCERAETLIRDILDELKRQRPGYNEMIDAKLAELCIILSRTTGSGIKSPHDISYIKNHIDENYNMKINLSLLANSCGYSYSYLRHRFKELYGEPPQGYLISVRLSHAAELLAEGKNCTEVCYLCGFSNCSQFTRLFKRRYGVLPKSVKAKRQNMK